MTTTKQLEISSPRGLRSPSSSSDIMSASGHSLVGGLPAASPRPLFVAQSAAETLASAELDRPVSVSEPALDLVNNFLDQILYNLLSLSKSTSLGALRVAIPKLLKPRLGQAALSAGEEEVRDILEASDFEQNASNAVKASPSDFDLELMWKLARLRCMVYSRLGDMEEEDEEELLEQERLTEDAENPQASSTPIEALFLAAVLGFLGEQALCIAAQHAEKRHNQQSASRTVSEDGDHGGNDGDDGDLVLEPGDVLQLGREGPLSRLWRAWRRDTRSTEAIPSRPGSRSNAFSPSTAESSHVRKGSLNATAGAIPEEDTPKVFTPSEIPLPMRDTDIDEIEVPGLAPPLEEEAEQGLQIPERSPRRPNSMLIQQGKGFPPTPTSPTGYVSPKCGTARPQPSHKRSHSLPTPIPTRFTSPRLDGNRDTVVFPPHEASSAGDVAGEDVELHQHVNDHQVDEAKQQHDKDADEDQHKSSHGSSRQSIISGTVAAIAGALGVEAMRASRMNKEQQDQSSKAAQHVSHPSRSRTVAEEILGPTNKVTPPVDAQTGPSITGPSDFDSMQIPVNPNGSVLAEEQQDDQIISDPEDLALSSADEALSQHQEHQAMRDSGLGVATHAQEQATVSEGHRELGMAVSPPSSPSSPKRAKREAAIYDNSVITMPPDQGAEASIDQGQLSEQVPKQKGFEANGGRASIDLPMQQPAPAMTAYPQRGSSREHVGNDHGTVAPAAPEYSQHSRGSGSSSSGKVFVYGRDSNSRPQNLSQQRAAFGEASQGGHVRNISGTKEQKAAASSGGLASRRVRLRLSTDEDAKISEDKKKSLEILIKSDETLHYTLTPESARAAEFSPADIRTKTETQDLADFIRNTAPPGDDAPHATARQNLNGLRSNPPETAAPVATPPNHLSTVSASQPVSRASQPPQSRNLGAPRDARPERNTTRDLADYVRSTGPVNENQLPQPLGTRPSTVSVARQTAGGVRADGVPVAPVGNLSQDSARPTTSGDRPVNRLKFQARDARPARNAETSELIDFIREGPPRTTGEHRIDRLVAPFRTTMDSDDLNALAPPPEVNGRGSVGSAPESAVTNKSVQESTNSRTALLESTNRANGASSYGHGSARKAVQQQNGMPPRTRRTARDPFAIDYSDDEMEEDLVRPKPVAKEESLIDFLRNTAPPPGMAPKPILSAAPRPQEKPEVKRSASNSKLKDVITRQTSVSSKANTLQKTNGPREQSPHLTQVGSKMDKYRPTQTTHAAHVDRNRQRSRVEARDPTMSNSTTADLATYLKNSGPPEPPRQQTSPTKDQAGFLKFFSRRGSVRR